MSSQAKVKVGTICYSHSRGLGHLAKAFYDHGIITDVLVIKHPQIPMQDWYPGAQVIDLRSTGMNDLWNFTKHMDKMLFFETPFEWNLLDRCCHEGIETYLIPMHECFPLHALRRLVYKYLCPSLLDMEYFPINSVFMPLPVEYPWTFRSVARHFVHNGGYLGLRGREGTRTLIDAMQYVKSPIQLTIRVQENVEGEYIKKCQRDSRITYLNHTIPYEELFATGDVYVAPQKFNGCSLPLQEAYASGMMVMTTRRFPMTTWLPNEPMIPVSRTDPNQRISGAYLPFDESIIEPAQLAATIDSWYNRPIGEYSLRGKRWAEENSWEVLGPRFREEMGL